jgi:hypothetical protein
LEFGGGGGRGVGLRSGLVRSDGLQKEGSRSRLGMSPLGDGDGAAATTVAATGIADYGLFVF